MPFKKIILVGFLLFQTIIFAQTEKAFSGTIVSNYLILQNIEVINLNSEKYVKSDQNGNFSIMCKKGDYVVFYSNDFECKKIVIDKDMLNKPQTIDLKRKVELLDEVVVKKIDDPKFGNKQQIVDMKFYADSQTSPKNIVALPDGTIENGMDFVRMFKGVKNFFKKRKAEKAKENQKINVKEFANTSVEKSYFTKGLGIDESQQTLFFDYCETDPRANEILKNQNILEIMDFFKEKSLSFKKSNLTSK